MGLYTFKPTCYISFQFEKVLGRLQKLNDTVWQGIWLLHGIVFTRQVDDNTIEYLIKVLDELEQTVKELREMMGILIEAVKNSQNT
jgi:hypothetical protein